MVVLNSLAVGSCDVERGNLNRCEVTLCLYHDFQHLGVGLSLQYLVGADVFGGNASNLHVGLLVTFNQHCEVRFEVAALAYIFYSNLATIDIGVRDDWVELSRRTTKVDDLILIEFLTAFVYI